MSKIYIGYSQEDLKEEKYNEKLSGYKERWKVIKIHNKKINYQISNHGRIRKRSDKTKIKDFSNQNVRYYRVSFYIEGVEYAFSVHRLVAKYFCKIPKRHREAGLTFKDLVPNHKDGNKHHNAAFNLEWVTQKENTHHAWDEGFCDNHKGEKCHLAKMNENTAIEICELIMQKKTNNEIIKITGASKKQIQHIRNKECWKHVTKKYDFPKLSNCKPYTIPDSVIEDICKELEKKTRSDTEIAIQFNTKREYVRDIRLHKRRKNISKYYDF